MRSFAASGTASGRFTEWAAAGGQTAIPEQVQVSASWGAFGESTLTMNVMIAHSQTRVISGAEWAILDMVRGGSSRFAYRMLVPGEGALARFYREQGVAVWAQAMETPRRLYPGLHTVQSLLLARRMRRTGIRLVIANTFPALARVSTACRMARIPLACYVREYIRDTPQHRSVLARATRVWGVSADLAGHLKPMLAGGRVDVVHDHLDLLALRDRLEAHRVLGRRLLPFDPRHPVVGMVGRLTPYKQQDVFLGAVPRILEVCPEARFVVIGGAGPAERGYQESLEAMVAAPGLRGKVVMLGFRPDAPELMSECQVIVVPSIREPYPRVILEAQHAGVPVVASDTGGCPEMVEDGVTGLLFDVRGGDRERLLADAVVRVLGDPALAGRLAEGGRRSVERRFAGAAPVRRLEALAEELAGG